jgi:NitT/TauT family transport system ATP-binding protein
MADTDEKFVNVDAFYLSIQCPMVSTDEIAGLVHAIAHNGSASGMSLLTLSESIGYDEGRLLALLDLLDKLGLGKLANGTVELTPVGHRYQHASGQARRLIFADQLLRRVPLVSLVQNKVTAHPKREVRLAELTADLRDQYATDEIDRGFRQLIDWARYAGLFFYDDRTGIISLQGPNDLQNATR